MEVIIAAISLGLLGSFHCIGMCGPIALSLPVHQYPKLKKYFGILIYNLGRILTYTCLGIVFGLLGQSFYLGGFQKILSIILGLLLLVSVILNNIRSFNSKQFNFMYSFINTIKIQLGILFNKKGLHFLFFIGLLNGLLPCGLVYFGIAAATSTGHYIKGAEFMFYFGIGTLPIMYSVAFFGQFITTKYRNTIRSSMPYVVVLMALMLIIRGLNLGIPYLSPQFEKEKNKINCCKKDINTKPDIKCNLKNCDNK